MHTGSNSDSHWAGFQYDFVSDKEIILMKRKSQHILHICSKGLFNNRVTHRGWVGLSVFPDIAWPKTREMSGTSWKIVTSQ